MKLLVSILALAVGLGFSSFTPAAEPATAPPAEVIRNFYRWYVGELIANRDPLANRSQLKRFVTERLVKEIERMKKGPEGLNGDYFVDAQDFDDLWAKNITVSDVKISGTKGVAEVLLAGQPDMRRRLQVSLVNEGGGWRVDKVKGRE